MAFSIKGEAGFSLVETLIATVIFAIVSASGVMILSSYQEGRLGLAAADDRLADFDVARALIRADMHMTVSRPVRDALGGGLTGFSGGTPINDGVLVSFVRNGDMGALIQGGKSTLKRVEYRHIDGNLIRRTYAQTDITPATDVRDTVLLSGLDKIGVRFEAEGIWLDEWGTAHGVSAPPNLTEFRFQFSNGRSLHLMFQIGGGA